MSSNETVFVKVGVLMRLTHSFFSNEWEKNIVALQPSRNQLLCFDSGEHFDQYVDFGRRTYRDCVELTGSFAYITHYVDKNASFEINSPTECVLARRAHLECYHIITHYFSSGDV